MPDNKMSNYEAAAYVYRPDVDTSDFDDGDQMRVLVKCTRCGAIVNGGSFSREKHDQFHAALAELWEMLEQAAIHSAKGTEGD